MTKPLLLFALLVLVGCEAKAATRHHHVTLPPCEDSLDNRVPPGVACRWYDTVNRDGSPARCHADAEGAVNCDCKPYCRVGSARPAWFWRSVTVHNTAHGQQHGG